MSDRRNFEFNDIVIFESLRIGEPHTGQMLYNDLIRHMPQRFPYVDTYFKTINSKNQFFNELDNIKANAELSGRFPFIHIEMHGSQAGLEVSSGEFVTWEALTNKIREINIVVYNNTLLSLATCCGAYIAGGILPSQPSPFWGFIGPWNNVSNDDIQVSFQSFFEFLYNSNDHEPIDFDEATKTLNVSRQGQPIFSFVNSESVFNQVFHHYEQELTNPNIFNKRVNDLMADALTNRDVRQNLSLDQLRLKVWESLIFNRNRVHDEMKRTFLMKK